MKLNIYEKKKVVKTYEADSYNLPWGVIEDVADAVDLDGIQSGSNEELSKMAIKLILQSRKTINYLMKDIFDGITEDELRHTYVTEIASCIVEIVLYTISELKAGTEKNLPRLTRT